VAAGFGGGTAEGDGQAGDVIEKISDAVFTARCWPSEIFVGYGPDENTETIRRGSEVNDVHISCDGTSLRNSSRPVLFEDHLGSLFPAPRAVYRRLDRLKQALPPIASAESAPNVGQTASPNPSNRLS
jgi:hypothetical protein